MKLKAAVLVSVGLSILLVSSQPAGAKWWMASHGGGEADHGTTIQPTPDGGYVVAGKTFSFGVVNGALWVVKLDPAGQVEWQTVYGDPGTGEEGENAYIRVTPDGGYVVASSTTSFGEYWKIWVLRLGADGSVVWQKTYRDSPNHARLVSIEPTRDRGFIVLGQVDNATTAEDLWLLKLDAGGNVVWGTAHDAGASDFGLRLRKLARGGYIVASNTRNGQATIPSVWKLDDTGAVAWHTAFCSTGSDDECSFESYWPTSVLPTSDGGVFLAGYARGLPGFSLGWDDMWAARLDAGGAVVWHRIYGTAGHDRVHAAAETADGHFILAGESDALRAGAGNDGVLMALDGDGGVLWAKVYGGAAGDGFARDILPSREGFTVVGTSASFHDPAWRWDAEVWVVKVGPDGECPDCPHVEVVDPDVVDVAWKMKPQTLATRSLTGTVEDTDADVTDSDGASLDICYYGHDLAVTKVVARGSVVAASPVTAPVSVEIQNRSSHDETVDPAALGDGTSTGLVRLSVSVEDDDGEGCAPAIVALDAAANARTFARGPVVLRPKKKLKVYYQVTYDCTAPLPRTGRDATRGDYGHTATVHHEALDGAADDHPDDDTCPRSATLVDPLPDGTIRDGGCAAELTDVVSD